MDNNNMDKNGKKTFKQFWDDSWNNKVAVIGAIVIPLIVLIINLIPNIINIPMWKQLELFYNKHKQLIEVENINETSSKDDPFAVDLYESIKLCNQTYSKKKLYIDYCQNLPKIIKIRNMNESDFSRFATDLNLHTVDDINITNSFANKVPLILLNILSNQLRCLDDGKTNQMKLQILYDKGKVLDPMLHKHNQKLSYIDSILNNQIDQGSLKYRKKVAVELCKYFKSKEFLEYQIAFQEYLECYAKVCEIEYNTIIYN